MTYTPRYLESPDAPPMPARRTLLDGCVGCGLSVVACDAERYVVGEACCDACGHP